MTYTVGKRAIGIRLKGLLVHIERPRLRWRNKGYNTCKPWNTGPQGSTKYRERALNAERSVWIRPNFSWNLCVTKLYTARFAKALFRFRVNVNVFVSGSFWWFYCDALCEQNSGNTWYIKSWKCDGNDVRQEYILVGCVPSAAVTVSHTTHTPPGGKVVNFDIFPQLSQCFASQIFFLLFFFFFLAETKIIHSSELYMFVYPYVSLQLRVQNRRRKWNFPLNFRTMCKLSECYSGIFQIHWLLNHLDVHLVWTTSETSQN